MGRKTETRRPVRTETCPWHRGRRYTIQSSRGRGPSLGEMQVLAVRQETLGQITFRGARAEGFRTRDDFYEHWQELHGRVDLDSPVWVVTFKVVETRHMLRPSNRPADTGDYTDDPALAIPLEPEAVDPALVDRSDQFRARRVHESAKRDARSAGRQLTAALLEAHKRGVNTELYLTNLRAELDELRRTA